MDHLEQAGADDAAVLGACSTIATLLPGSVFHLGLDRYAPARSLIENGAAVALTTDFNPGTSPKCSMPWCYRWPAHMECFRRAISAATINGAHAARRAQRIGSLVPVAGGLIMLNADDYREIPYYFLVNLVAMTTGAAP